MQITKNFSYEELVNSSTADRLKIKNIPNSKERENLITLCETVLQPIRDAWGKPIVVNSGYRCKELNKAVGGASNSDHLYGSAVDIHTKENTKTENKKLFDKIVSLSKGKLHCRQIIDEYNYKWIHVSVNHDKNKLKNNQILHLG